MLYIFESELETRAKLSKPIKDAYECNPINVIQRGMISVCSRAEKEREQAEHENALGRVREAANAAEQQQRAQVTQLTRQVEAFEAQLRRAEWRAHNVLKEKDIQIDK